MSTPLISLHETAPTRMLGMRRSALPLRARIEAAIADGGEITIDFSGVEATQSFVDELLGVLVLKRGPDVLDHIIFKGCSPTVKAIIEFVATDRAGQFARSAH